MRISAQERGPRLLTLAPSSAELLALLVLLYRGGLTVAYHVDPVDGERVPAGAAPHPVSLPVFGVDVVVGVFCKLPSLQLRRDIHSLWSDLICRYVRGLGSTDARSTAKLIDFVAVGTLASKPSGQEI